MTRNHTHTLNQNNAQIFSQNKNIHTHTYTDTKLHAEMKPKKTGSVEV